MTIISLKKRKDFLDIAKKGSKIVTKGLVLQVKRNINIDFNQIRVGYTVTKKVGNAVKRNKIKRKLRAAVRFVMSEYTNNSFDYVIIGRKSTLDRNFNDLIKDLKYALNSTSIHR